jgi:hypothetical protein
MNKPKCDLLNCDGNAFAIMGAVSKALRKAGQGDKVDQYMTEAKSGDYDHLLQVSLRYVEVEGTDEVEGE